MSKIQYDFKRKSIRCETWEQMLHLSKLAKEQGYLLSNFFSKGLFNEGNVFFTVTSTRYLCTASICDQTVLSYSDFINSLPNEVLEVTGCDKCVLSTWNRYRTGVWCGLQYENEMPPTKLFVTCPLKKSSLTIKLKSNDTTTSNA